LPVERVAKRLIDRVKGRVDIETVKAGPQILYLLSQEQEAPYLNI
jgi:hypothetical protein